MFNKIKNEVDNKINESINYISGNETTKNMKIIEKYTYNHVTTNQETMKKIRNNGLERNFIKILKTKLIEDIDAENLNEQQLQLRINYYINNPKILDTNYDETIFTKDRILDQKLRNGWKGKILLTINNNLDYKYYKVKVLKNLPSSFKYETEIYFTLKGIVIKKIGLDDTDYYLEWENIVNVEIFKKKNISINVCDGNSFKLVGKSLPCSVDEFINIINNQIKDNDTGWNKV